MTEPTSIGLLSQNEIVRVARGLSIATFHWDARSDVMRWSRDANRVLGIDLPATGTVWRQMLTAETAVDRNMDMPALDRRGGRPSQYLVRYQLQSIADRESGNWLEEQGFVLYDEDGCLTGMEGTIRATKGTRPSGSVPRAVHPGTGLVQRDGLLARTDRTIREIKDRTDRTAAFLVVAVDELGALNSNFGYDVGNRIIEVTSKRIAGELRVGDIIGHLTGHKFGILLNDCDLPALEVAARRFCDVVGEQLIATDHARVAVSISIGAVMLPTDAASADQAALRAEEALTCGRARGSSFNVFSNSALRDAQRRRNADSAEEIVAGLEEDRFIIAYQPLVDARTRRIVSYEALARLVRRDGTVVSAGPLVETAERIGLVRRIDQRALRLVLDDLGSNPGLKLSVNVSAVTLSDPHWLAQLVESLTDRRDIAERLTIEITETAAMSDLDDMLSVAASIRNLGCRVAIDDFGAGQTSFKALKDLRIDLVKIDGLYIRDLATNPDSVAFVKTLAALVEHFKISTVAEWVQDEESATILKDLGINTLQGKYAGEPLLRHTGLTAAAISKVDLNAAERQDDGYPTFGGVLKGPLSIS